jgi:hypothetical protein
MDLSENLISEKIIYDIPSFVEIKESPIKFTFSPDNTLYNSIITKIKKMVSLGDVGFERILVVEGGEL